MSTLVDREIRNWASAGGLVPFDPSLVNPASVNLRIGPTLIVESPGGGTYEVDISESSSDSPFIVDPGEWFLAQTMEIVKLSDRLEAEVCLRSSAARRGWQHALAGYVDPEWEGRLTLEFQNVRRYEKLPIFLGMQLCQLRLSSLRHPPRRGYSATGRYYGDLDVQVNRDQALF